jgi:hypothetical protein
VATGARRCAPTTNRRNHNGGVGCGWRFLSGRGETSSTLPDLRRTVVSRGNAERTLLTGTSGARSVQSQPGGIRCASGMRSGDQEAIGVLFGGRGRSLLALVDSWAGHVIRLGAGS